MHKIPPPPVQLRFHKKRETEARQNRNFHLNRVDGIQNQLEITRNAPARFHRFERRNQPLFSILLVNATGVNFTPSLRTEGVEARFRSAQTRLRIQRRSRRDKPSLIQLHNYPSPCPPPRPPPPVLR